MVILNEALTLENLERHLGLPVKEHVSRKEKEEIETAKEEMEEEIAEQRLKSSPTSFLDFFENEIKKLEMAKVSLNRKDYALKELKKFKRIRRFEDLTVRNIMRFDDHLDNGERARTTIWNIHKNVHTYVLKAWKYGYIDGDPYAKCDIDHGQHKERKPLNEAELLKLIKHPFEGTDAEIRDLFIFSAYTGLAYADTMLFRYSRMTDEYNGQTFIDGNRLKTGSNFYTPILPHAMDVLKKYGYNLPYYTNQACNKHLREIREACGIKKKMTFHIARHSFATLCLSYDIPIEQLAKMMGHKDIKVTQIYAKIMHNTIMKTTKKVVKDML